VAFVLGVLLLASCGGKGGSSPAAPTPVAQTRIIRLEALLQFGDVPVGSSTTRDLRIYNDGNSTMTVTGMTGPSGYTATWTSGTIAPGTSQVSVIRFSPTTAQTYDGTLTVQADHTSGSNTTAISGRGARDIFRRSGTGDSVFDMPLDVARVRIIGIYTGSSSNFIVRIGGRLIVNELLGTFWGQTRYDGTLLTGGGASSRLRTPAAWRGVSRKCAEKHWPVFGRPAASLASGAGARRALSDTGQRY
jgi:HYDIN/CFA65/VesB-like, Ig-like domain